MGSTTSVLQTAPSKESIPLRATAPGPEARSKGSPEFEAHLQNTLGENHSKSPSTVPGHGDRLGNHGGSDERVFHADATSGKASTDTAHSEARPSAEERGRASSRSTQTGTARPGPRRGERSSESATRASTRSEHGDDASSLLRAKESPPSGTMPVSPTVRSPSGDMTSGDVGSPAKSAAESDLRLLPMLADQALTLAVAGTITGAQTQNSSAAVPGATSDFSMRGAGVSWMGPNNGQPVPGSTANEANAAKFAPSSSQNGQEMPTPTPADADGTTTQPAPSKDAVEASVLADKASAFAPVPLNGFQPIRGNPSELSSFSPAISSPGDEAAASEKTAHEPGFRGDPKASAPMDSTALMSQNATNKGAGDLRASGGTSTAEVDGMIWNRKEPSANEVKSLGTPSKGAQGMVSDSQGTAEGEETRSVGAIESGRHGGTSTSFDSSGLLQSGTRQPEQGGSAGADAARSVVVVRESPDITQLRQEILSGVMEVKHQDAGAMTVVLRPDAGTELNVQIRNHEGSVEVVVRVDRGDVGHFQSSWESLRHTFSQQGVRLADLQGAGVLKMRDSQNRSVQELGAASSGVGPSLSGLQQLMAQAGTGGSGNDSHGSSQRGSLSESRESMTSGGGAGSFGAGSRDRQSPGSYSDPLREVRPPGLANLGERRPGMRRVEGKQPTGTSNADTQEQRLETWA